MSCVVFLSRSLTSFTPKIKHIQMKKNYANYPIKSQIKLDDFETTVMYVISVAN